MAKVNQISICPACGADLTETPLEDGYCPHCHYVVEGLDNKYFKPSSYVFLQFEEHREKLEARNLPSNSYGEEMIKLTAEQDRFFQTCSDDDRISALEDAFNIIRNIVLADCGIETKHRVISKAKNIGKLAEHIESSIKYGVTLHGNRTFKPPIPTTSIQGAQTAK